MLYVYSSTSSMYFFKLDAISKCNEALRKKELTKVNFSDMRKSTLAGYFEYLFYVVNYLKKKTYKHTVFSFGITQHNSK